MEKDIEIIRRQIENGETCLGIELGSTRIKAMLIDADCRPVASGSHAWENRLVNQVWTYNLEDILQGLTRCYGDLVNNLRRDFGVQPRRFRAIGISGMMHGYMAFDRNMRLLAPFRTWRNSMTAAAAEQLTQLFGHNIPERWSVAHLYQSILNQEAHVGDIRYLTTLSGYIHWLLTGEHMLGIGDASGMFPIDPATRQFDQAMLDQFDSLLAGHQFPWKIAGILPRVLVAGDRAGALSGAGARLIDPSGWLEAGIPLCPPEGDAGTGMVATNSIAPRTGNVSAGTSIFAMLVLENKLSRIYPEVDIVTTPAGDPVAMVHCNNGTSELDGWARLLREFAVASGAAVDSDQLYQTLFNLALQGDPDCGGLVAYNYLAGEQIVRLPEGRPLFFRRPDSRFTLANFMRAQLYSIFATLKLGMNILARENIRLDRLTGHGGLFQVKGVAQRILAAALNTPVTAMATAGNGGPWGVAVLASYMLDQKGGQSLSDYLSDRVFVHTESETFVPDPIDVAGFSQFLRHYEDGLAAERMAARGSE